jgi:hypothetical protein
VPVRTVRRLLVAVCLLGIPGMIATSIADSTGGALTFGLMTAAAVCGLILVTSVTAAPATGDLLAEAAAERVEAEVAEVVARGADEDAVRRVVRAAVRLGWVQGRTESGGPGAAADEGGPGPQQPVSPASPASPRGG